MMARHGVRVTMTLLTACMLLAAMSADGAPVKARTVVILPFDASALDRDEQWIGEGAAQVVALGLAQHPAFVQVDRSRVRSEAGRPELWGEPVVLQAARALKADAALYGRITRQNAEFVVQPRVVDLRSATGEQPV